jgi:predicted acyltransferase
MIQNKRLVSLDVFRGLTVMLMIFVNNGAGNEIFSQLKHSKWNGLTLTDLVFPFFLFIMGASCYLSLKKSEFIGRRIFSRKSLSEQSYFF